MADPGTVTCASCGTPNEAGRKFCMECGSPLGRACPTCGTPNPPQSKFCGECGTALEGAVAAPPPAESASAAASTTERRLVSVMFLDLVSFTTLSEQRDAEDMRALLDRYFETARSVIERHGGFVEKFIGDAVMALWGAPVTHEDDAERAVRTALELVDAVAALGAATGTPLQARAGVLTGEAATTSGNADQGMVTGDMVNTASRLQSAAAPGQVFVGDPTYRAASRAIAFEEVGNLQLKGKEEAVRAWRALRVVAERQGQNRMAIEPPFVGRAEELRLLKELLHASGRDGKTRVVSVTGIGGIGKSRLAWELLKYIDGLSETVWWHHGRCPAYGEGVTFWALGEMVRMRAQIAETDPPTVSRSKLAETVAAHVPDEEDRRWIEPRLAFLLGLEERPVGGGEELFAAWRAFFERVGETGVVAMVFEDLQWADPGLLDFIESMLEWSKTRPIFIVTLSRPELADRRPNWGAGQRNFATAHLEPLGDEAMGELVRGLVPGADEATVARIVERAEGVPLYAVEMIRMLADRGVLRAGEDAYELVGDLGELQVPETLHALVASRLDALGPEERALVQEAAVLGKTFTLEALAAVTGADAGALEPRLQDLVRREFLAHEVDPRSPERGQYGFVQGIIREVAYGMLSKADRRERHLAAAHHLEAAGDDELAGVVAAHYTEALRATSEGPDADALAARARDWLGQAAERARALGSPGQAVGFFDQALAITPAGRERADLLRQAAEAATDALMRERQIALLQEAVEVLHGLDEPYIEVATMGRLASALSDESRVDELRSLVERMRASLGDGDDVLARAELDHTIALLQYYDHDYDTCLVTIDRALGGFERAGAWERFQLAIGEKSGVLGFVGRKRERRLLIKGRLAVAQEEGDVRAMAAALGGLALWGEELLESVELFLQAADTARRGGYGENEMNNLSNGLEAAVEVGAWAEADRIATELRDRSDLPRQHADTVALGTALLAAYRGDAAGADAAMDGLHEETKASPDQQLKAWLFRARGLLLLMRGDLAGAFDQAANAIAVDPMGLNVSFAAWTGGHAALWLRDPQRARQMADALDHSARGSEGAARATLDAGVSALEGHLSEARSAFDAVLADRLAVGDRFFHGMITLDAVAVLPPELVPDGAVESARTYLEEIGASALLERLAASEGALRR
jgi:class 3 adenylate cyclase